MSNHKSKALLKTFAISTAKFWTWLKFCIISENNLFPKGPEEPKEVDVEQKNQSCCA